MFRPDYHLWFVRFEYLKNKDVKIEVLKYDRITLAHYIFIIVSTWKEIIYFLKKMVFHGMKSSIIMLILLSIINV